MVYYFMRWVGGLNPTNHKHFTVHINPVTPLPPTRVNSTPRIGLPVPVELRQIRNQILIYFNNVPSGEKKFSHENH